MSISPSAAAVTTASCTLFARVASCTSRLTRSADSLFGLTSRAITLACGSSSESSSSRLGFNSAPRKLIPVRLPPGRAKLATRPVTTGSFPAVKTIGIVQVAFFASYGSEASGCHNHIDLAADEIGSKFGQPIIPVLRPAVFERNVLSLDIAGLAQPPVERGHTWRSRARRRTGEEADHRNRLVLRAR